MQLAQRAAPLSPPPPTAAVPPIAPPRRAATAWSAWLLPSFADLIFLACLFGALHAAAIMLSGDGDPARHLVVGRYILATGAIPSQSAFVYTVDAPPFVPHEWLAEVAAAASYRLAGLAGDALLHAAAIGLAFGVLFCHLRHRGHGALLAGAVTVLAAAAASVHWLARPHVFTFLGIAVFGAVLDGWHAGRLSRRWLWALPLVTGLWANLHGGFLAAFLLLGAYLAADVLRTLGGDPAARRRLRSLLPVGAASLAATAINPFSPLLLLHVTDYVSGGLVRDLTLEYLSPDFHQRNMLVPLAMLLLTIGGLAWSRRRPALHEGLLLLGFTAMALYARRFLPLYAIATAPLLAAQLAALPAALPSGSLLGRALAGAGLRLARRDAVYGALDARARGHLWPALVAGGLLWLAASQWQAGQAPLGVQFDPARQPVAAVAYLQAHPVAGNGFNEQRWGGYLLHELWPAQRVFIDDELNVRTEPLARDYLHVVQLAPGWQGVLDRYDVRWALSPTDSPLVRALAAAPGWQVAYQDPTATLLTRD